MRLLSKKKKKSGTTSRTNMKKPRWRRLSSSSSLGCLCIAAAHRCHGTVAFADDWRARSMFGTQQYWDEVYRGQGDFPADTYSWYMNWNELQRHVRPWTTTKKEERILLPGIGNDSLLVDMMQAGYRRLVAQDYSSSALERQIELLEAFGCSNYSWSAREEEDEDPSLPPPPADIQLSCSNVIHSLPASWQDSFDMIIEKGLLDAVYLSDQTTQNVQCAIQHLDGTLKVGGIFVSVSSVIPPECRRQWWPADGKWEWTRDGHSDPQKAGCFIFRKVLR